MLPRRHGRTPHQCSLRAVSDWSFVRAVCQSVDANSLNTPKALQGRVGGGGGLSALLPVVSRIESREIVLAEHWCPALGSIYKPWPPSPLGNTRFAFRRLRAHSSHIRSASLGLLIRLIGCIGWAEQFPHNLLLVLAMAITQKAVPLSTGVVE